ncbi:alpha/beta hydrolase [Rhodococcus rhodochrous]|uniref:alpha/beta hydrolase n=1 Tax=Rhodococcus rhodochrous TaxID=1829 RepID=UPI00188A529A|nr:alpha/beta hydrolase [Rhodococcus rhodochrous]MBF4476677.1 alpha/beta hydrolase [Rhodococcus rhodochrous]
MSAADVSGRVTEVGQPGPSLKSAFPVNPEVQALLDLPEVRDRELTFTTPWDPDRCREIVAGLRSTPISGPAPFPVADVEDVTVAGTGVRIYRPVTTVRLPIVVFFHGGGWVFGDLDTQDFACRALANAGRALVVSVDYGLAPEHPFPGPVLEAIAVTKGVLAQAEELSGDPTRMIVAGASSGGNLAAAVALDAAHSAWGPLAGQVLIYPPLDATTASASYTENAAGFNLSAQEMRFYWQMYHQGQVDLRDPRLSPLFCEDLSGLPPTLIFTAEYDVLRDEGEAYAARLQDAGVPTYLRRYDGQIHGFLGLGHISADTSHGLHEIGLWVREQVWDADE